jgi:hypothetical protein
MIRGPKLSNFKMGGPNLQNNENRETKTAIKPSYFFVFLFLSFVFSSYFIFSIFRVFLYYLICLCELVHEREPVRANQFAVYRHYSELCNYGVRFRITRFLHKVDRITWPEKKMKIQDSTNWSEKKTKILDWRRKQKFLITYQNIPSKTIQLLQPSEIPNS